MRFLCWLFQVDCEPDPEPPKTGDLEQAIQTLQEIKSGVFFLDEVRRGRG
jgi:hypothetical protein